MPYLSSLPADAGLLHIFRAYPDSAKPLLALHEVVMRGPSATAAAFGVPAGLLTSALADLDSAPVDDKMKPLLRYLAKVTRTPALIEASDAQAVYAAGWDERALHDAVQVCALFNFMNRMVDGLGVPAIPDNVELSGARLHDIGYAGLAALIPES